MAKKKHSTEQGTITCEYKDFIRDETVAEVAHGLARMADHFGALYGSPEGESDWEIESYADALSSSWPIQEALDDLYEIAPALRNFVIAEEEAITTDIDPTIVLVVLAGRMFLAGRESMISQPKHQTVRLRTPGGES